MYYDTEAPCLRERSTLFYMNGTTNRCSGVVFQKVEPGSTTPMQGSVLHVHISLDMTWDVLVTPYGSIFLIHDVNIKGQ